MICGLAYNLNIIDDPYLDKLFFIKRLSAFGRILLNLFYGLLVYPTALVDHPSNGYRLAKDALPDPISQTTLADYVHFNAQKLLQLLLQSSMAEQSSSSLKLHQKIYIAIGVGLASGYGAEDAQVIGTVLGGYLQDLLTPGS